MLPYLDSGSLTKFIKDKKITSELEAIEYFRQICYATKLLHEKDIVHRSLSTDMFLANSYSDPLYPYKNFFVLTDYGRYKDVELIQKTKKISESPIVLAPEIGTGKFDKKADIYSLGCIFFTMLTRSEPFSGKTPKEIALKQGKSALPIMCAFGKKLSVLTMAILEGCLQYNQLHRMAPNELYDLLDIKNLYDKYIPTVLDKEDESQSVCLKEFSRKKYVRAPIIGEGVKIIARYYDEEKINTLNKLQGFSPLKRECVNMAYSTVDSEENFIKRLKTSGILQNRSYTALRKRSYVPPENKKSVNKEPPRTKKPLPVKRSNKQEEAKQFKSLAVSRQEDYLSLIHI